MKDEVQKLKSLLKDESSGLPMFEKVEDAVISTVWSVLEWFSDSMCEGSIRMSKEMHSISTHVIHPEPAVDRLNCKQPPENDFVDFEHFISHPQAGQPVGDRKEAQRLRLEDGHRVAEGGLI